MPPLINTDEPVTPQARARPFSPSAPAAVLPLGAADLVGFGLFALLLMALSALQSRHRMFWSDEIMGGYVLHAGSFSRFLTLWRNGIDSSGIWYYVFAWPWERLFGPSEISIRMFSGLGVVVSAGILWVAARRFYSAPMVAASIALLYLDIDVLRWQLSNGRCYGLLMAAAALALYMVVRGDQPAQRHPSWAFLAAVFFSYNLLAGSHILGSLYASAFLGLQLALDLWQRRFRPLLYLSGALGIGTVVLFSLPNLRSTMALGKPVFWTLKPNTDDLWLQSPQFTSPVNVAVLVLFLLVLLHARRRAARDAVYLLLLGFMVLDALFYLISQRSTSIYVDRYMLPLVFAPILLSAECLMQLREDLTLPAWLPTAAPFLLLLYAVYQAPRTQPFPLPQTEYVTPLLAALPPGLPVVDTDVGSFVELEFYRHNRFGRSFLFPLDPEVTHDPSNPGGVSGFNEMANFARLGLDAPDLQPTPAILARYGDFIVLTNPSPSTWFHKRILSNPHLQVRDLGLFQQGLAQLHLWEVRRL